MERVLGVARGSNARTSGTGAVLLRSAHMMEQQNKYFGMVRFGETFGCRYQLLLEEKHRFVFSAKTVARFSQYLILTHICPEILFITEYSDVKSFPFLQTVASSKNNNNRGKYSTTPSLNKGCPSSEVHVSRMPNYRLKQTNKTSYAS